ncbi:MAG: hypothetical protein ACFCVK_09820 [Acidimicrobiales bacterium]
MPIPTTNSEQGRPHYDRAMAFGLLALIVVALALVVGAVMAVVASGR